MNEKIQKWLDALRSGEYKQTIGHLHDEDGYCCLGVLCEVAMKEGVPLVTKKRNTLATNTVIMYNGCDAVPPQDVVEWAGLGFNNPNVITKDGHENSLAKLNDEGMSFSEIADLIEANLNYILIK